MSDLTKSWGNARNERGLANERRLLATVRTLGADLPWFVSAREGTRAEDREGIDVVIETNDIGPLYLQSKSSKTGAAKFRRQPRSTIVEVVIVVDHNALETRRRTVVALLAVRRRVLVARGAT